MGFEVGGVARSDSITSLNEDSGGPGQVESDEARVETNNDVGDAAATAKSSRSLTRVDSKGSPITGETETQAPDKTLKVLEKLSNFTGRATIVVPLRAGARLGSLTSYGPHATVNKKAGSAVVTVDVRNGQITTGRGSSLVVKIRGANGSKAPIKFGYKDIKESTATLKENGNLKMWVNLGAGVKVPYNVLKLFNPPKDMGQSISLAELYQNLAKQPESKDAPHVTDQVDPTEPIEMTLRGSLPMTDALSAQKIMMDMPEDDDAEVESHGEGVSVAEEENLLETASSNEAIVLEVDDDDSVVDEESVVMIELDEDDLALAEEGGILEVDAESGVLKEGDNKSDPYANKTLTATLSLGVNGQLVVNKPAALPGGVQVSWASKDGTPATLSVDIQTDAEGKIKTHQPVLRFDPALVVKTTLKTIEIKTLTLEENGEVKLPKQGDEGEDEGNDLQQLKLVLGTNSFMPVAAAVNALVNSQILPTYFTNGLFINQFSRNTLSQEKGTPTDIDLSQLTLDLEVKDAGKTAAEGRGKVDDLALSLDEEGIVRQTAITVSEGHTRTEVAGRRVSIAELEGDISFEPNNTNNQLADVNITLSTLFRESVPPAQE